MASASLVFPHQLFKSHPALKKDRPVFLIEDTLFFGDSKASPGRFHKQKIILHRASMRAFAAQLKKQGYQVNYIDYNRTKTIERHVEKLIEQGFDELHYASPCDFLLKKRLLRCDVSHVEYDSPMFLTPSDWADEHFQSRKKPFMAAFYEAQRKRMGILIDSDNKPIGGRWSFDDENRKPMPKRGNLFVPDLGGPKTKPEVVEAIEYVEKHFSDYPGETESFHYPINHRDSNAWFKKFLTERFEQFGPYEDAISETQRVLFHSILTPMLNIGLLTPQAIVDTSLEYAQENDIPINSLEGFIRQVIGWREFMYQMYDRHGVEMRTSNFFNHELPIPESFWTGKTGITPIDQTIYRIQKYGYCHHIERLMLLGNFMLLCGFHPTQVNDWFMELFIDAYDWVMVPNVYGMSQFADGGIFTTKPYISGSNYVKKMSDYAKGEWCDQWDALFWNFIQREREFISKQHRLGMMVRTLDKMDNEKRSKHEQNAQAFLSTLTT